MNIPAGSDSKFAPWNEKRVPRFAEVDTRLRRSEAPKLCPKCGWPTIIGSNYIDCSNFDDCEYCEDLIDDIP